MLSVEQSEYHGRQERDGHQARNLGYREITHWSYNRALVMIRASPALIMACDPWRVGRALSEFSFSCVRYRVSFAVGC